MVLQNKDEYDILQRTLYSGAYKAMNTIVFVSGCRAAAGFPGVFKKFASNHALKIISTDSVSDNLLECIKEHALIQLE